MFDIATISSYNLFSFLNIFGDDLLRATISLFAVINPIGTIPLFASITQKMQKNERDRVLKTTVITASALLMNFAVAGTHSMKKSSLFDGNTFECNYFYNNKMVSLIYLSCFTQRL